MSSSAWPVWDRPVRFMHWYFPVALGFMWWSGEQGYTLWHSWCGYSLIVIAATRLLWGFVGSYHTRFSTFLKGPKVVVDYLRGRWEVKSGHNPLGGWASLLLVFMVLNQGATGLFTSDDISFEGPLAYWGGQWSSTLSELHHLNWVALQGMVVLHLLAVAFHQGVRKEPMIQGMWRGQSPNYQGEVAPAPVWKALAVLVAMSTLLSGVIALAPQAPAYY